MLIFFNFRGAAGTTVGVSCFVNLIGLSGLSIIFLGLTEPDFACAVEPLTSELDISVSFFASATSLLVSVFFFSSVSLSDASFSFSDNANFSSLRDVFNFLTGFSDEIEPLGSSTSFL